MTTSVKNPTTYGDVAQALAAKTIEKAMTALTRDGPLGLRPDPASLSDMLDSVIDEKVAKAVRWHGISGPSGYDLEPVADMVPVRELLARGWAVLRPDTNK